MQNTTKLGIIGQGHVGQALAKGFTRAGYEVQLAGRDVTAMRQVATASDVLFLAVPFGVVSEVVDALGASAHGKVLVDVTNALTKDLQLALGFTTSGAEELQKRAPQAKVVKAFNTVFAQHMAEGVLKGEALTLLVAGDDAAAKATVLELGRAVGLDAVDTGPLGTARHLEALGYLNILLGYVQKLGPDIGFRLVR
jgi:hypothetical protein